MTAFGVELTLIPSEGGLTTKKLILNMIEAAREFSKRPHTFWTDQLKNLDSIAGYYPLAEEILDQTNGAIDAFVHCVGTAASLRGVATVLKKHNPKIKVVAVEPAESSVLSGGQPGPHKIEGVGIGTGVSLSRQLMENINIILSFKFNSHLNSKYYSFLSSRRTYTAFNLVFNINI